jgi:hypothetical protein
MHKFILYIKYNVGTLLELYKTLTRTLQILHKILYKNLTNTLQKL